MEKKFNLVQLLKDCPKGMELDSPIWDGVVFDHINMGDTYPIYIKKMGGQKEYLTENGCFDSDPGAKCVIFPKGKDTWEGFKSPFKDGDIIADNHKNIAIYKGKMGYNLTDYYCGYRNYDSMFLIKQQKDGHFGVIEDFHFATEEEKQKLFRAIKDNGYKWNPDTKTLEELIIPKFKEGDRIILKDNPHNMPSIRIKKVTDVLYILDEGFFYITSTDERYVLEDKFHINNLKPFDRVLVRTKGFTPAWTIDFYDGYRPEKGGSFRPFAVSGGEYFQQCIPYEGNEYLLGTTNDCDDFYKNWEE